MVISYLIGYLVVGVPAAYLGCGVWSLVAAQLLLFLLNAILLVRITKVPITLSFRGDSPGIVNFGMKITAANLSSWSIGNLDTVFVGRAFGVVDLGLYSRAINLLSTPMNIITTGFQGVLLSACAQAQNNPGQIKRIFLETNAAVALLCFPIFVTTSIIPKTLVLGIYGSKWEASAAIITPLSLAVLVHALLAIEGPILTAMDRVGIELKNQIYTILLFIPILLVVVQYSLVTVAWAVFAIYMIRWILLTIATLRLTGATATEFLATLLVPAVIAAAIGTVAAVTDHYLFFLPAFYRLATVGCAAFIILLLSVRLFGAHFLRTNISSLVDVNNLSGTLRKFLNL
jgi:PST family polysaccharide transporter